MRVFKWSLVLMFGVAVVMLMPSRATAVTVTFNDLADAVTVDVDGVIAPGVGEYAEWNFTFPGAFHLFQAFPQIGPCKVFMVEGAMWTQQNPLATSDIVELTLTDHPLAVGYQGTDIRLQFTSDVEGGPALLPFPGPNTFDAAQSPENAHELTTVFVSMLNSNHNGAGTLLPSNFRIFVYSDPPEPTPEPVSASLVATSLIALLGYGSRRSRRPVATVA